MEEFFLHAWDELDDMLCACRHVATTAAAEALNTAVPFIAAVSGVLLAGTATVRLAARHLAGLAG